MLDRLAIRELVENWAVWRDAGDWERFRPQSGVEQGPCAPSCHTAVHAPHEVKGARRCGRGHCDGRFLAGHQVYGEEVTVEASQLAARLGLLLPGPASLPRIGDGHGQSRRQLCRRSR